MQRKVIGAVLEEAVWSKKDEREDHRDHYVVVQTAAWMRPQDVTLNRLSESQRVSPH